MKYCLPEFMENAKRVVILHPFMNEEISSASIGGTRLIFELKKFLEERYATRIISLSDMVSLTGILHKIAYAVRNSSKNDTLFSLKRNEKKRWFLNLLYALMVELLSRFDIYYIAMLRKNLIKFKPSIIIFNYPFGCVVIKDISKKLKATFVLYEHNVEWKFFAEKVPKGMFGNISVKLLKIVEMSNLNKADYVCCVTNRDRETLIEEAGMDPQKIKVWMPPIQKREVKVNLQKIPNYLKEKIDKKFIVGFLGTNFEPNIIAVKNILRIAETVLKEVVFLVIGSVNEAFESRNNIPQNVIFTGHVKNLDEHLSLCHIFINPKTTSDTGIEIKMFDYLKFNKPIIATQIGARGFEKFKNVVICDLESIPSKIGDFIHKWRLIYNG